MKPSGRVAALCLALVTTLAVSAHAAWPPAPGADMRDRASWPDDYDGRWSYLSYFPDRTPSAGPIDPFDLALGASGMSVDRAWTHTIGRPETRIAVVGSGIAWHAPDLVNKAALNAGELKGEARPRTKDGAACGGAGALAGYDCNGDGAFDVADYRDDPRITPVVAGEPCFHENDRARPGGDRLKGDLDRNCVIDPGDLVLMFSDGVDDDANGYTDDICGWDFFENDNDPFDASSDGHGTAQALASVAQANNGAGLPGVCPGCTFVPLRAADGAIGEANDLAKALVYAADSGVKIVQAAIGTVDQTRFVKAAIDYAYAKGVVVVTSVGDDASRRHDMPATSNHVLTVHPVRYDGADPTQASTFVAFDTCSSWGGQLSLSISAIGCSRAATGPAAGIAGLVHSVAAKEGLALSAAEVIQLFKMEADDIDVPGSHERPTLYPSQPGFDQRFGYGRANAARIVEAIEARRIPPEVDLTSPEWFAPIHADRSGGPIPILGRVSALRAQSYDVRVQWAPGVEPLESDYRDLVAPLTNIPGGTVTGGAVPLAQLDPAQLDTSHPRDPDAPLGEDDRSISIRVRAVAHHPGYDVAGEARRVVAITNQKNGLDADLLPGFPLALGASLEASPKLADLDGDGVRDVVVPDSAGRLHAFTLRSGAPVELPGFPYLTRPIDGLARDLTSEPTVPNYLSAPAYAAGASGGGIDPAIAREALVSAPAIADLDGDGRPEIVVASWPGTIYVVTSSGQDLAGWPRRLPLVPSCPHDPKAPRPDRCADVSRRIARGSLGAPVLADMDRDGRPEIIVGAFDGQVRVFKADGAMLDGFPVALAPASGGAARIASTPTVVDLNGDGIPEIVSGLAQPIGEGGAVGPVFVLDGRGTKAPSVSLPGWPIATSSLRLSPIVAEGVAASQAAGDFDGDGRAEIVVQGNGAAPLVLLADPGPQRGTEEPPNRLPVVKDTGGERRGLEPMDRFGARTKAARPDVMAPLFAQPSLGDVDQDGVLDLVTSGASASLVGELAGGGTRGRPSQRLLAIWSGRTGAMLPGSPVVLEDTSYLASHAIADVSGDDYPEVITGTGGYLVHAVDGCGREAPGFPKRTNGWVAATPAVGDVDGDPERTLDVVVGTREGYLFAWRTRGRSSGVVQWESFHHDNANTGDYATPLEQGTRVRAAAPLSCADDRAPAADALHVGAGCACRSARAPGAGGSAAGLAMVAIASLVARRRLRASAASISARPGASRARPRRRRTFRR